MTDFAYSPMFPQAADNTAYELVSTEHVEMVELGGEEFLKVDPEALRLLAQRAFTDNIASASQQPPGPASRHSG